MTPGALAMKRVFKFIRENILGVLTGVALAFIVWKFTGFNLWILLAGFIAGYYALGIGIEFLVLYFDDCLTRKPPKNKKIRPDKKAAIELAMADKVRFVTDNDLLSPPETGGSSEEQGEKTEPEVPDV